MRPYFEDDAVQIWHGDCREVLPMLDSEMDVIFDPPYGVGIRYGEYQDEREGYWDWFLPTVTQIREVAHRVVFTHRIESLRHVTGWDWCGVWNKPGSFGARIGNSMILPHWEPIFLFGIHDAGTQSEYRSDVFTYNPQIAGSGNGEIGRAKWETDVGLNHPCPKPMSLMKALILAFGAPGRVILDPFMGSGTTLRAAKDLGRKAIGIEIEERYAEMAAKRMSQSVMVFG